MEINPNRHTRIINTVWFYTSQVLSIIGLAGILDDLRSWLKLGVWLKRWVIAHYPMLLFVTNKLLDVVHDLATLWRELVHPVVDVFIYLLPFKVPYLVKDLIVIIIFVITGWMRANSLWSRAYAKEINRVAEIARNYGVNHYYGIVAMANNYLEYANSDRASLKAYTIKHIETLESLFKERTHAFANEVINDGVLQIIKEEQRKSLSIEPYIKFTVAGLAAVVSLFLLLDLWLF